MILVALLVLSYSIIPTYCCKAGMTGGKLSLDKSKNKIALTFDDGPDIRYTTKLLDVLKENNVKATFFIVAKHAEHNPWIIDRMISDGHTLGLHSLEHKNILARGFRYTRKDFRESIRIVKEHDWPIHNYRPPWGQVNIFSLYFIRKFKLDTMMWNVMVGDWSNNVKREDIEELLMKKTKNGSIICLHDGRGDEGAPDRTIEALKNVLPKLKNKYEFCCL